MNILPARLDRIADDGLQITWSDHQVRRYTARELRAHCPCATCREKRSAPPAHDLQLTVIPLAEAQPTRVAGMRPVGNYAYNIAFNDGHDTGIYTFALLRELGVPATPDG